MNYRLWTSTKTNWNNVHFHLSFWYVRMISIWFRVRAPLSMLQWNVVLYFKAKVYCSTVVGHGSSISSRLFLCSAHTCLIWSSRRVLCFDFTASVSVCVSIMNEHLREYLSRLYNYWLRVNFPYSMSLMLCFFPSPFWLSSSSFLSSTEYSSHKHCHCACPCFCCSLLMINWGYGNICAVSRCLIMPH